MANLLTSNRQMTFFHSLSVGRRGSTDKLLILNNLSRKVWGFPDKITFCEITINRNSWGAHGKKCGALRRMERHRIGLNRTTCISWFGVYYWVSRRYSKQLNAGYVKKWVTWLSLYLLTGYESTLSSVVPISGCSVFLSDHALRKQSSPVTISSYVWLKWSWPATRSLFTVFLSSQTVRLAVPRNSSGNQGIIRCRAGVGGQGRHRGDGKPAGPDRPLEKGVGGI